MKDRQKRAKSGIEAHGCNVELNRGGGVIQVERVFRRIQPRRSAGQEKKGAYPPGRGNIRTRAIQGEESIFLN